MGKIETLNFGQDFIEHLAAYVHEHYVLPGKDLSRLAIVFGGKRPSLFVKRALHQQIKTSFYSPRFFAMDELIKYIVYKQEVLQASVDLDQCYLLYHLAQKHAPQILAGRETFAQFLPWTREILSFIDHVDLEDVADDKLRNIQDNAQIGYAVPADINRLLESIVILRGAYHVQMRKNKKFSRGLMYRCAMNCAAECDLSEFDQILFCNFFHFNESEAQLAKVLHDRGLATFLFQGDQERWPTLKRIASVLGQPIRENKFIDAIDFELKLYSAFDGQSQVATVREILKRIEHLDRTVIVLPDSDHIIPLLSEINPLVEEFNISMGYPLKRSSLYSLLDFIFKAQLSRAEHGYYTRDFLRVLRHPLIKNLDFGLGAAVSRIVIHKIEEMLTGMTPGALTGHLFINLGELAALDDLYDQACQTLGGMDISISREQLKTILLTICEAVFSQWEKIHTFFAFAQCLDDLLQLMLAKSFLRAYPLNLKIAEKMFNLKETIEQVDFRQEHFSQSDIFKIFAAQMEREIVAFTGSPLKGLQILGLFETRALNFEQVIVLDANEGVLPRLNVYEPLIPREVMLSLQLDRLEQEEEIQRYQFMRLISSAKCVHLIYEENPKKEKSRFVEELVWEQQKKKGDLDAVPVVFPSFSAKVSVRDTKIYKTPAMIDFLKEYRYSASSINAYVRSPVEFYYNYVLGLREKENLADEPQNRQVGTFVHGLLEETYQQFLGKRPVIDEKFKIYFLKVLDTRFAAMFGQGHASDAFLLKKVLDARMKRFLEFEAAGGQQQIQQVLYIEKKFTDQITLSCGKINLVYRVDRVDQLMDGTVMIIDYKTGSVDPMPKAIESIENMELSRENIRDQVISFQIPLYFQYLHKAFAGQRINAAYYNLRTLEMNTFLDHKMTFDNNRINAAFLRPLDFIITEILNPNIPFSDENRPSS
ncbi:MAG: PD-(D/E)XK nuclease family protein [Candidatus Omnitrophica bacterium]|nr:PD-(D/E)XK nuclease family protein [Candidatus Omnitrophota bacterium]